MLDPIQLEANKRRLQWRLDFSKWAREVCHMEPTPQQDLILKAISETGAKVTVKSGHSCGKSSVASVTVMAFLDLYDECKIVCTAPAARTLKDNLWAEAKKWMLKMDFDKQQQYIWSSEYIRMASNPQERFATARTSSKDRPEALQGAHSPHLLFVLDEASGISDEIFTLMEGSLTGPDCRVLMISNPTKVRGYFYDSHHIADDLQNHKWKKLSLSSAESPLVTKEWVEAQKRKHGEKSNFYRIRILGQFPEADADTLIQREWIEESIGRQIAAEGEIVAGGDVGSTGDDSAITIRKGHVILHVEKWHIENTMETAGKFAEVMRAKNCQTINIDAAGIGLGVAHKLMELGFKVNCINAQQSSSYKDSFMRLRDELWWKAREFFETKMCSISDTIDRETIDELMEELSTMHWETTAAGKKQMEPKHTRKADRDAGVTNKLKKSPNLADSFIHSLLHADILGLDSFAPSVIAFEPKEPEGTLRDAYL